MQLAELLAELKAKGAKVAGSYARGEQRPDSDLGHFHSIGQVATNARVADG